ncbi:MAG: MarR family transcriptional regulator [bacterium]
MKLEEEIKQKKFRNSYHKLAVNIIYTHGWLMQRQNKLLKQHDLTGSQFNILRILRGQHPEPASVSLLQERMLDKLSDASRLVERLREKGFVDRKVCPSNRRKAEVVVTESGLKALDEIDKLNNEVDSQFKNLTTKEAETINNLLDKLRG